MDANDHDSSSPLLIKLRLPITLLTSKSASVLGNAKVHAAAACVQILYAGFQVLASAALTNGASKTVFPVYRNAIAAVFLGIIAFFTERKTRPPLTFIKISQLLLCGFIGVCINQLLFLTGLYYTSATFASTVQNLTPALTFVVAVMFGIERLQIKKLEDQAKVLGVLVGMGGASLIAFYKGPSIIGGDGSFLLSFDVKENELFESSSYVSLKLGLLCLLGNCTTWAIWFILQAPVARDYPAYLSATTLTYIFGSIQLAIIAICVERDLDTWAATFYMELPALLYGGLVASGVAMTLQGWCAYRGGPVLVAAYQPLQTILVAILSSLFLHETFYLGSLIGGLFVVVGLYLVVWGKSREKRPIILSESQKYLSISSDNSREVEESLTEPLLA
ncbi:hypothetical protein GOP47_0014280 [Adiantum capillus-veneris]|uniref:WAT1-related protein n=1 Tax=Adiantum capillus-veneris TaxID=13818 RepID=A0A9D4ZDC6_ADICA|nr:hypothetical protein GOP47_0014280 [Adiantum capillus-veneris]